MAKIFHIIIFFIMKATWIDEAECQEVHYPLAPSYDPVTLYLIVSNLADFLSSEF